MRAGGVQFAHGTADVMRAINRKAGVSALSALAHQIGLQHHDAVTGAVLCQATGSGQTGQATADNHPISLHVFGQSGLGRTGSQEPTPPIGLVVLRQTRDFLDAHATVRALAQLLG